MKKVSEKCVSMCFKIFVGAVSLVGLSACSSFQKGSDEKREVASMGPPEQNSQGSYQCQDVTGVLKGKFTFGEGAELEIKGRPVKLSCQKASRAPFEAVRLLRQKFVHPVDVCTGQDKGYDIVLGTSDSSGIIQMKVFRLDNGQIDNEANLDCEEANGNTGSRW